MQFRHAFYAQFGEGQLSLQLIRLGLLLKMKISFYLPSINSFCRDDQALLGLLDRMGK